MSEHDVEEEVPVASDVLLSRDLYAMYVSKYAKFRVQTTSPDVAPIEADMDAVFNQFCHYYHAMAGINGTSQDILIKNRSLLVHLLRDGLGLATDTTGMAQ